MRSAPAPRRCDEIVDNFFRRGGKPISWETIDNAQSIRDKIVEELKSHEYEMKKKDAKINEMIKEKMEILLSLEHLCLRFICLKKSEQDDPPEIKLENVAAGISKLSSLIDENLSARSNATELTVDPPGKRRSVIEFNTE